MSVVEHKSFEHQIKKKKLIIIFFFMRIQVFDNGTRPTTNV